MALQTQQVPADLGSEEVTLTRQQLNALMSVVYQLFTAIAASTDASGIKSGAAAISLATLKQIVATHELPKMPLFPSQTTT